MKIPVTGLTLLRIIALTSGPIAFAVAMPVYGDPYAAGMLLALAVIIAGVFTRLIADALARRQRLMEAMRIELNKIRRIYHLSKNLSSANPAYRTWFTDMHGFIYGYLMSFQGKDFDAYDGFNASFRKLSYHIYTLPELSSKKEEALFNDLLRTTSTVAEARQQIKELWDNRMSAYGWTVVLLMTMAFAVTVVLAMADTVGARLSGGLLLSAVLLTVDFLWEADTLVSEKRDMARRYVDNIGRLELGRKEE